MTNNGKEIEKSENFAASIKLPEGHELLIGELPAGTILEVATWHGIGRPDETTNRFLMSADGPGLSKKSVDEPSSLLAIENQGEKVSQESTPTPTSSLVSSLISGAPFLGVRDLSHNSPATDTPKKTKRAKRDWSKPGRTAFFTAAVIALFSVVLNAVGISVVVPTSGAKTFFGTSTTSLVFYMRSTEPTLGVPTVANSEIEGKRKIYYGISSGFSESQIQIATTDGQILVATNSISGRAFLAIPLLGWLVKPLFK